MIYMKPLKCHFCSHMIKQYLDDPINSSFYKSHSGRCNNHLIPVTYTIHKTQIQSMELFLQKPYKAFFNIKDNYMVVYSYETISPNPILITIELNNKSLEQCLDIANRALKLKAFL